jgi:hypothetical protein
MVKMCGAQHSHIRDRLYWCMDTYLRHLSAYMCLSEYVRVCGSVECVIA